MPCRSDIFPVHLIRRGPLARNTGGPIRVISDIIETYGRTGFYEKYGFVSVNESHVYESEQNTTVKRIADSALKHHAARKFNTMNMGLYLQLRRDAWRLRNRLKRTTAIERVVHSHDQLASGLALGGAAPVNLLTIHSKGSIVRDVKLKAHPQITGTWMETEYEKLERVGIRAADAVVFPSAGAREMFERDLPGSLDGRDTRVIHNGVDMAQFPRPVPERAGDGVFTIASVCALVPEKRFDRTLEIAAALREAGRRFRLVHIGTGALREEMEALRTKHGLQNVILRGPMEHSSVLEALAQAHAFLLPAERTVFDIATLEAMASGLPVVVSDEGGNREMVTGGEDGLLCAPDDTGAYVHALQELMDGEERRSRIGNAARKTVRKRFTLERMVEQYDALYEKILESRTL